MALWGWQCPGDFLQSFISNESTSACTLCGSGGRSTSRIPTQIMTVIIAEPPKLNSGSGMPTTGARPITIIMLIAI